MNRQKFLLDNNMFSLTHWLENHWATPAYSGWVLIGIALSFFGAATNTMAGWLYALSGVLLSLLGLNFVISIRTLKQIQIKRLPIKPVSVGDELTTELFIINPTKQVKNFIEVIDEIPLRLSEKIINKIETISPKSELKIVSYNLAKKRGIYHWHHVKIKTATPFGLFYATRQRQVEAKAIIYPQVLPLQTCPLIDNIGTQEARQRQSNKIYQNATEGITKAIREYRYGDATRLIHWRSSARFGDLQVRELETITGGEEIIICLDNSCEWEEKYFEEAVIVASSMYFYASRQQLEVKLWTADIGIIHGNQVTLETLAGINDGVTMMKEIPSSPVIWLSQDINSLSLLTNGSRWMMFSSQHKSQVSVKDNFCRGIFYSEEIPLQSQLQKPLMN
ncbi:hypothetical protein GM3708_854 [Geminocystis sp. NIES-3708]|uniref:DUF58 domain-containing protein n=1 Tax=Geminocystis sp. NIES-3708 TaxID=1615909 RepID=UPI0005FC776B|nr:DUF58 domain-containing protein [Geminocystis sp. NIES-3708]BAQ60448.1 hypothetical protein GM3708_854 [Geminocystis sp. NIES-3708]